MNVFIVTDIARRFSFPVLCLAMIGWASSLLLADTHRLFAESPVHQRATSGCDTCSSDACECYGVDTDPGHPRKPKRTMPGDRDRGDCPSLRYRMDDEKRSGHAGSVAPWAQCGRKNTKYGQYTAWYVGGGAAFAKVPTLPIQLLSRGRDRKANGCGEHGEGTWGLDYEGLGGYSKVWLQYTQGRKQGGEGRYQTDGEPKFIAKIKETLHH